MGSLNIGGGTLTGGPVYWSGTAEERDAAAQGNLPGETDHDLFTLHNHGRLLPASSQSKHLLQFFGIFIHVHVNGPVFIGFPSLVAEGSGIGAVNDDFVRQTPCH